MRNSFSFDLKILKKVDILVKVGMSFQSLTPRYIDLRPFKNVFLEGWKILPLIDPLHNDVISFEILPGTSLAAIQCGSKSQKRALLSTTHEIVLYL